MNYRDISRIDKTLRPYQQKAKDDIFSLWDECDNVMFQMPTGTGKTRLFTSIISDIKAWGIKNQQTPIVLIIAHRVELIEQISETLDKYKVSHGIIAGGKDRDLRPLVQVASIQTITHRTNKDVASSLGVDFIIIDEAHHSVANSYKKLWELYPNTKKLGVTATPWRMNHLGFSSIYDRLLVSESIKEFIKEGWLAPYSYYSIKDNSEIRQEISGINEFDIEGDYKVSALERVIDKASIRANLLTSYQKFAGGKKGIIYSISRKHSDHICEEYRQAGINIVRIDSETPREERRTYVQRFRNGLIDIIVNVDIFSEGFDCPDIEFIQLARPTKSLVKYLQQVGRGLRPVAGKGRCIILDNVGSHIEFGLPNAERDWAIEFEGENVPKRNRKNRERIVLQERKEKTFDEGSDKLYLIEEGEGELRIQQASEWMENDDTLLKLLFVEKHCSLDIIASVFHVGEAVIKKRLHELELVSD